MDCIIFIVPMNLCPCGYFPDLNKCRCSAYERKQYINRVSGPLLDRMDICVTVEPPRIQELTGKEKSRGLSTKEMSDMVLEARRLQKERYNNEKILYNSHLSGDMIEKYCKLKEPVEMLLKEVFLKRKLSARAYYRILKLSRTIADLEKSREIKEEHMIEALNFSTALEAFR